MCVLLAATPASAGLPPMLICSAPVPVSRLYVAGLSVEKAQESELYIWWSIELAVSAPWLGVEKAKVTRTAIAAYDQLRRIDYPHFSLGLPPNDEARARGPARMPALPSH
jgi:hypothetical protein